MRNIIILSLLLISLSVNSDMNDCAKMTNQNDKNYCMAKYSGSGSFCDKIRGYELRTQCTRMVIAKQRESAYSTKQKTEEKGE